MATPARGGGEGEGGIAAIFSGPTNDADYNAVGLKALKAAESAGAEISFSEKVAVPDVEARLTEAVGDGATVVWTHGWQFYDATAKVATNNPDVNFIAEYEAARQGARQRLDHRPPVPPRLLRIGVFASS